VRGRQIDYVLKGARSVFCFPDIHGSSVALLFKNTMDSSRMSRFS
jgi:hypothetical protein